MTNVISNSFVALDVMTDTNGNGAVAGMINNGAVLTGLLVVGIFISLLVIFVHFARPKKPE